MYRINLNTFSLIVLAILSLSSCDRSYSPSSVETKPTPITGNPVAALNSERYKFYQNGKFGYIDRNGNIIVPAQFNEYAGDVREGLATVQIGDKYASIDSSGKVVNPSSQCEPIAALSYSIQTNDLTPTEKGGKYGYIDRAGKVVIPFQFDFAADNFVEDIAWVAVNGSVGYINKQGKTIVSPQFDYRGHHGTGNFDNGLARVCSNRKCGYIDRIGKIVIPLKFDDAAKKFRSGLAWVKIGERLGFIDKTGKLAIPAQYMYLGAGKPGIERNNSFDRSLALVIIRDKCSFGIEGCYEYGYIDPTGKLVFKF